MPPPSTCLVVAGLIQPNFWPLRYLAAVARSGYGEPNSDARGLDKSIHSSLHDAPSSDPVCDENGTDLVDTVASSFDTRWKVLCQLSAALALLVWEGPPRM
jgi:hypothetical protein